MKRIFFCLMISFFIIVAQSGCSGIMESNTKNNTTGDNISIENYINGLIDKSLKIQYGSSEIELSDVFTDEYIEKVSKSTDFYKKDLAPYKIVNTNLNKIKDTLTDNITINVRVNDKKGDYIQVIHFVKKNKQYLIDNIEYDI